jgi:hypothetical protein
MMTVNEVMRLREQILNELGTSATAQLLKTSTVDRYMVWLKYFGERAILESEADFDRWLLRRSRPFGVKVNLSEERAEFLRNLTQEDFEKAAAEEQPL